MAEPNSQVKNWSLGVIAISVATIAVLFLLLISSCVCLIVGYTWEVRRQREELLQREPWRRFER